VDTSCRPRPLPPWPVVDAFFLEKGRSWVFLMEDGSKGTREGRDLGLRPAGAAGISLLLEKEKEEEFEDSSC